MLDEALDSLLPPRRRALEVALLLTEPGERPPDPLAIGLAVHDVLRVSAQQGPLLVAELAAADRSNKEIAAELFMGVSTVEAHLSHACRKLGIRSRAGLGTRLPTAVVARAKPVDEAAQS